MLKYSVGLDISSKNFQVCISVIDRLQKVTVKSSSKFANNPKGFEAFHLWVCKHYKEQDIPLVTIMEATGVYYENLALWLHLKGYKVSVVLPNKAKKYLQAMGLKSKNDTIDAQGLARMGAEQSLDLWQPKNEYFYQLRSFTRQHQSLQELKTNISNQLHANQHEMYHNELVTKQLCKLIEMLDEQLHSIESAIVTHIKSDQEVFKKVKNITAIKGVGVLTVAVVLAETNGFELFRNIPQLVSYAGYDVVENQSGKHVGKTRISKKGNGHIRRCLHMPAFSVVRHKQAPFVDLFNRTFKRHGKKMKSYVAVQKKILVLIYTLWKKGEVYQPDQNQKHSGEQEQVFSSLLSFAEAGLSKKNSATQGGTTQGKHSVEQSQYVSSLL